MKKAFTITFAVLLVVALVAATPVGAEEVYTVDENTGLDNPDTISTYKKTGVAETEVSGLDMKITVAEDARDAGMDTHNPGLMHTYIRVEYREDIARTVRFYVPTEYVQPRLKEDVQAENDEEAVAMYEPVAGGEYMAVTIQFQGATDATFDVNWAFGRYISMRDGAYDTIENTTGYSPPRLGSKGHTQWQYPPDGALAGDNATYHLPTNPEKNESASEMTIQFDNKPNSEEAAWMTMPKCEQTVEPVCVTERDGEPVLFSTSSADVPPIRYKHGTDRSAEVKGAVEELKDGWRGAIETVKGLLGGGS